MSNHSDWKKDQAFLQMNPKKQKMILLLTEALNGKKLTEALPVLMKWKQEMEQEGISFTPEENNLLTEVFTSNLTPAQRQQYEFLKPFIKNK